MSSSISRLAMTVVLCLGIASCGARTGLPGYKDGSASDGTGEEHNAPPSAICPEEAYASPGKPAVSGSGP
ncbi:MAG: hypothetical protein JRG91_12710 [Deltaproteobacteria bacterium]|nr:hypothetical protein [Deltaproteobacteria bacterium]